MIEFIESVAEATGLPVGIKSAVGEHGFWSDLAARMAVTGGGPDFITVDGGEGGTGAAPLVFGDHVALPFLRGFPEVYRRFAAEGLTDDVVFVGSGRLGLPHRALAAMALGCDMVNVAREADAGRRVHPGPALPHRATARRAWPPSGPGSSGASYLGQVAARHLLPGDAPPGAACGWPGPAASRIPRWVGADQVEFLEDPRSTVGLGEIARYRDASWGRPGAELRAALAREWAPMAALGVDTAADRSAAAGRSGDPGRHR